MKKIISVFVVFSIFVGLVGYAQEAHSLRLILKRVVFEGPKRAEVLTLINATDKPQSYRLEWRHLVMKEEGGLDDVSVENLPPEVRPSKDFIRYAPRRVTLAPKSSQQVRMMLRLPADVEDGEYRSHLWIRREANVEKLTANPNGDGEARRKGKVNIGMKLLPGITIPVIVRKGNLTATANISNASARLEGNDVVVSFDVNREGGRSTYGDIDMFCNSGNNGYSLRSAKGVAVYAEINRKAFSYKISAPEGEDRCRNLLIRYTQTDGYDGDPVRVLAEANISVQ